MEDEYLTTQEVAKMLRVKPQTVRAWRMDDNGPPYIKVHKGKKGTVRYSRAALVDYIINDVRNLQK